MARSIPNQYPVVLTDDQRQRFDDICRNGHASAKKIQHAKLLLLSDKQRKGGPLTRSEIAERLKLHPNTVDRIRKRFVLDGEGPSLERKPRQRPPVLPIIDGRAEAQLLAICCSEPPAGRTRWTLKMLAEEMVGRKVVTQVSAETVRRVLKKTS